MARLGVGEWGLWQDAGGQGGAGAEVRVGRTADLEVKLGLERRQGPQDQQPGSRSRAPPCPRQKETLRPEALADSSFTKGTWPCRALRGLPAAPGGQDVCMSIHALLLTSSDPGQFL